MWYFVYVSSHCKTHTSNVSTAFSNSLERVFNWPIRTIICR